MLASSKKCPRHDGLVYITKELSQLEPTHTYKLWNSITEAMKNSDMKTAAKRKSKLEQWQRHYFKKLGKEAHIPTYFKPLGELFWIWKPMNTEMEKLYGPSYKY